MRMLALLLLFAAATADACTTFCMTSDGRVVFGANYDWDTGVGLIMVNKRSVAKDSGTGRPARWVSRFASITLNQYGRDYPTGGMNEAGLTVGLMALGQTQYPAVDERSSVGILGWIQYQLDLAATIDDVLQLSAKTRVTGVMGLHYLVSDRSGRAVTIEYLGGNIVAHRDAALPVAVLTNSTYDDSVAYLHTIAGFGGRQPIPTGIGSLERFAHAAAMIRETPAGADPVARAFEILGAVHQPGYTRWSVVYDPAAAAIHLRTDVSPQIRTVSFASFALDCTSAVKIADINGGGAFTDYTTAANLALVNAAYDATPFLAGASPQERIDAALHPESDVCRPAHPRAMRP